MCCRAGGGWRQRDARGSREEPWVSKAPSWTEALLAATDAPPPLRPPLLGAPGQAAGCPPPFWGQAALRTTQQPLVLRGSGLGRGFTFLVDECF